MTILELLFTIFVVILFLILLLKILKHFLAAPYKTKPFSITPTTYREWETVFSKAGPIQLDSMRAGDVFGTIHDIVNMKNPNAKELPNQKLTAPLFAHHLHHDKFGDFLVDTGFDQIFSQTSWGRYQGLVKKKLKFALQAGDSLEEHIAARNLKLKGVFCTHFHEHQGGATVLPLDIPFVYGLGEKELDLFPIAYSRFLKGKNNLQEIDFSQAGEMPILGKVVDIWGDGTLWAISTPGHSKGHVSWLVNGIDGIYLIFGDLCMCQIGYDMGVESGGHFADNLEQNQVSFIKVQKFLKKYPQVKPIFGHESDTHRIVYTQI